MDIKPIPPQEPVKKPEPENKGDAKKETNAPIYAVTEQLAQLFRDILHEGQDKDIKK